MSCSGCGRLREEFRVKKLGLNHDDPSVFVKFQCGKPAMYVVWVVVWALYHVTMLLLETHYQSHLEARWLTYLTNLTYLVQGIGVVVDCIVTCYVHTKRKDIRDGAATEVTWYIRVQWVLFNVYLNSSIMVTIIYYVLLDPVHSHTSVNKHLLNTVYTLLLLTFSAKPVQILHCYQPMMWAAAYTIFSIIYQKATGDAVYGAFDWDKPEKTSITIVVFIFVCIPVVQVLCFAWYMLRLCISHQCCLEPKETYDVSVELGETKTKEKSEISAEAETSDKKSSEIV